MNAHASCTDNPDSQAATVSETMQNMVDEASLIEWLVPLEPEEAL